MIGRVNIRNMMIYLEFFYDSINVHGNRMTIWSEGGYIYFTEDPLVFVDVICLEEDVVCYSNILKSLRHDGIFPNLVYLCQEKNILVSY